MTTTPSSIAITTQIRQGASTALSIWYDFTDSDILMSDQKKLQSLLDPAIKQWWLSQTNFQRSVHSARSLNLKISASYLLKPKE